jgi:hypothetical protein
MTPMAIQAMATRRIPMDILVEATMSPISDITMIGKTITATDITIRSAATAALPTQVALAAVDMDSAGEALAVAMVVAVAAMVVAGIAERDGLHSS